MCNHILYLAGGCGRRFGSNKLLAQWHGKSLYRHTLEMLRELEEERNDCTLTVVSQYPDICRAVKELGVRAVYSPESALGVSYTLRRGIESLGLLHDTDFILAVVADQPCLQKRSVERLLDCARPETETARLCWKERPGNPILFSAALREELMALRGDQGGRTILSRHACTWVQAEKEKELYDIDTQTDLQFLK